MASDRDTNTTNERKTNAKVKVNGIRDGWFSETEAMWPGQRFSLALEGFSEEKSVLFSGQSDFQSILVFRSAQYGNVLVLDGVIQLTERDEFSYQEMMVHLPLFSHACPKKVLIVGGGDGGVLREVCRHDCVESVTMVEIDPMVIEVSKTYFAESTATSFDDPRVTIVHEDAAEFLRSRVDGDAAAGEVDADDDGRFDVIIADTSDPVGPAATLFEPDFYEAMHGALNDGGLICAQGECMWVHLDLITDVMACCGEIFDTADYATTMVPTYPCGQIGFIVAGKGEGTSCRVPRRVPTPDFQSQLRWYNPTVHRASFVLPQFVEKRLAPLRQIQPYDEGIGEIEKDCFLAGCTVS